MPIRILVDADACPVKNEVFTVAYRHDVPVVLVTNAPLRLPGHPLITQYLVSDGFDAADDHIAATTDAKTVVITSDILLADRCLKAGGTVLRPNGQAFTAQNIGSAIATRAILSDLRAGGDQVSRNAPFSKQDRSRFLSTLHETLERMKRRV